MTQLSKCYENAYQIKYAPGVDLWTYIFYTNDADEPAF